MIRRILNTVQDGFSKDLQWGLRTDYFRWICWVHFLSHKRTLEEKCKKRSTETNETISSYKQISAVTKRDVLFTFLRFAPHHLLKMVGRARLKQNGRGWKLLAPWGGSCMLLSWIMSCSNHLRPKWEMWQTAQTCRISVGCFRFFVVWEPHVFPTAPNTDDWGPWWAQGKDVPKSAKLLGSRFQVQEWSLLLRSRGCSHQRWN